MKYQYKTVTFGSAFSTKGGFNDKLQKLIDEYANKGWRLHTMQVPGAYASVCVCVFEKASEE